MRPPKIYCRAESLKSPEPGAIYPMGPRSARNLAVYEGSWDLPNGSCTSLMAAARQGIGSVHHGGTVTASSPFTE
jgi:hypothetical protein